MAWQSILPPGAAFTGARGVPVWPGNARRPWGGPYPPRGGSAFHFPFLMLSLRRVVIAVPTERNVRFGETGFEPV
ncbi:hypothetical protein SODG_006830 [Sodalis praecaptivus]